jgi:nucleotide-binding universal stress UspA family protein
MNSHKELRPDVEQPSYREPASPRGSYGRILIGVSNARIPAEFLDYVSAWSYRDAVIRVAAFAPSADGAPSSGDADDAHRAAEHMLYVARNTLLARGLSAETEFLALSHLRSNSSDALAETARRWEADLLMSDCTGPVTLACDAKCPVLTVPAEGIGHRHVPPRRIFVASDDSDASRAAVSEAARIAGISAVLRVGYVAHSPVESLNRAGHDAVMLEPAHAGGNLGHAIGLAAQEWNADLLVMGTHGKRPTGKWRFASIAQQVSALALLPLLLVPHAQAD